VVYPKGARVQSSFGPLRISFPRRSREPTCSRHCDIGAYEPALKKKGGGG
jgi:hypothetical protein